MEIENASKAAIKRAGKILRKNGAKNFEVVPLATPPSYKYYQTWLKKEQQAGMDYMKNSRPRRQPEKHFKPMKSIFVFQEAYFPTDENGKILLKNLKIAHYARQKDYHLWFKDKLSGYTEKLKEEFPEESFRAFTDSVPLLERDYGRQAGLGWIGKNTCLIHPKQGSFFFIGEILSSLESPGFSGTFHDLCGSCTACMEACPTGAILSERVLDANLCLAYWNIESREPPPPEIRHKMGSWFFGCDICQNACPWNIRIHRGQADFISEEKGKKPLPNQVPNHPPVLETHFMTEKIDNQSGLEEDLRFILESSNKKLMKTFKDSPLSRAGGRGLKRNALIVIANSRLINLKPLVKNFVTHKRLGELARWTLEQLKVCHTDRV